MRHFQARPLHGRTLPVLSRVLGVLALLIAIPVGYVADLLEMGILTTVIMLVVSVWEGRNKRLRGAAAVG